MSECTVLNAVKQTSKQQWESLTCEIQNRMCKLFNKLHEGTASFGCMAD